MSDNESVSNILSDALATVDASVPAVKTTKPRKVPKSKTVKPVVPPVAEPVEPTPTAPVTEAEAEALARADRITEAIRATPHPTLAEAEAFAEQLAETARANAPEGVTRVGVDEISASGGGTWTSGSRSKSRAGSAGGETSSHSLRIGHIDT